MSDCYNLIKKKMGNALSEDELKLLISDLEQFFSIRQAMTTEQRQNAVKAYMDQQATKLKDRKKAIAFDKQKIIEIYNQIYRTNPENVLSGLTQLLAGSNYNKEGARQNVYSQMHMLKDYYLGTYLQQMETIGTPKGYGKGAHDRDLYHVLYRMTDLDLEPAQRDASAKEYLKDNPLGEQLFQIAKTIRNLSDELRQNLNQNGASIRKMDHHTIIQKHDAYKISKAGFDQWSEDIQRLLPTLWKNADTATKNKELRALFDHFTTNRHLTISAAFKPYQTSNKDLVQRFEHARGLRFSDPDTMYEYNQKYGLPIDQNIQETIARQAQALGLTSKLGVNADRNLKQVLALIDADIQAQPSQQSVNTEWDAFVGKNGEKGRFQRLLDTVTGETNIPLNATAAEWSTSVRSLMNMRYLGRVVISALPDMRNAARSIALMSAKNQIPMARLVRVMTKSLLEFILPKRLRMSADEIARRKELLVNFGVMLDSAQAVLGRPVRGNLEEAQGVTGQKIHQGIKTAETYFFRYNGLNRWNDTIRSMIALDTAQNLGKWVNAGFQNLEPHQVQFLNKYNITELDQQLLSQIGTSKIKDHWGERELFDAANLRHADDRLFQDYAKQLGKTIAEARAELLRKTQVMVFDQVEIALNMPDAKTKSLMTYGLRRGGLGGELIRFAGQFKTFLIKQFQTQIGRDAMGQIEVGRALGQSKANFAAEQLKHNRKIMWAFGNQFLYMTAIMTSLGIVTNEINHALNGKDGQDLGDPDTWIKGMIRGGAWGFMGDLLFDAASVRRNLFGPAYNTAEGLGRAIKNGASEPDGLAQDLVQVLMPNIPVIKNQAKEVTE